MVSNGMCNSIEPPSLRMQMYVWKYVSNVYDLLLGMLSWDCPFINLHGGKRDFGSSSVFKREGTEDNFAPSFNVKMKQYNCRNVKRHEAVIVFWQEMTQITQSMCSTTE